ncbi:hypothetical protein WN55_05890 [Dufourea novaeangliae]|uniref:DUF4817 domain-containing protein n=1 Tax=Dufourea novaeangliae TaxID=178035 RepID=A0A154PMZ4_DUFNO|nr:hypothetical protein WN55_05890 [Dufourea novaeangliae]
MLLVYGECCTHATRTIAMYAEIYPEQNQPCRLIFERLCTSLRKSGSFTVTKRYVIKTATSEENTIAVLAVVTENTQEKATGTIERPEIAGMESIKDPFKAKNKIIRSPERLVRRERSHSLSDTIKRSGNKETAVIDITEWEERSPKQIGERKRCNDTQDIKRTEEDPMDAEIKIIAEKLKLVNEMTKALNDRERECKRVKEEEGIIICPKCIENGKEKVGVEIGTQTVEEKELDEEVLIEAIKAVQDQGQKESLLDRTWPERAYTKTKLEWGRTNKQAHDWDMAIITEGNEDKVGNKEFIDNSQEYEVLKQQKVVSGDVAYVKRLLIMPNKEGTMDKQERYLYRMEIGEKLAREEDRIEGRKVTGESGERIEAQQQKRQITNMFEAIKRITYMMEAYDREKVVVYVDERKYVDKIRKIMELIFRDTMIPIVIHGVPKMSSDPEIGHSGVTGTSPRKGLSTEVAAERTQHWESTSASRGQSAVLHPTPGESGLLAEKKTLRARGVSGLSSILKTGGYSEGDSRRGHGKRNGSVRGKGGYRRALRPLAEIRESSFRYEPASGDDRENRSLLCRECVGEKNQATPGRPLWATLWSAGFNIRKQGTIRLGRQCITLGQRNQLLPSEPGSSETSDGQHPDHRHHRQRTVNLNRREVSSYAASFTHSHP